jgi:hypothetical protein
MVITYLGMGLIKIGQGDLTIAFNPISKDYDSKAPKFGADLTLVSLNDPAYNGTDNTAFGAKEPLVIDGPGEYERSGVFVKGMESEGPAGKINTIYTVQVDGVNLCHLGALASPSLTAETMEEIGSVDIIFVPVGGDTLNPKEALKLASSFEAKMIVPLNNSKNNEAEQTFLKEAGAKGAAVDKLTIKKKDLEGKEGEIVVLTNQ